MLHRKAVRTPEAQDGVHVGSGRMGDDTRLSLPPLTRSGRAMTLSEVAVDGGELTVDQQPQRQRSRSTSERFSNGGASLVDRVRTSSDATRIATLLSADRPRETGVAPNLSGIRSLFVSDCHYEADELAHPRRAQTPSTPWNPQPSGRQSANREQLGIRALRDLGILQQVQSGCDSIRGPGSDEIREAYRLLTVVEPPRAALLSTRVARAKPTLIHNPGAAHLLLLLEVASLYAAEDLKGAAAVLLDALTPSGGYAGSPEVQHLYERVVGKTRFHRHFFDKKAPRLPEVQVRPPTPEPEPEPEVYLGGEWEGRLKRLRDLWSLESDPREALIALRGELRERIAMLSKVYVAYCSVDGHGQKVPEGNSSSSADHRPRLVSTLPEGGDGLKTVGDLLVVRVPSAEDEANLMELHTSVLWIGGLQGHLAEDEEAVKATFSKFGVVLLVKIRRRDHDLNWALVGMLCANEAETAIRSGAEEMLNEHDAADYACEADRIHVDLFDTRQALESTGKMRDMLHDFHDELVSRVQAYDGGIERLLQLQSERSSSKHSSDSSGSSSNSQSEDEGDDIPDVEDGGGVGLTMEMSAYEKVYLGKGGPRMFQFQWWRLMKACKLPSSDLRNHEINALFHRCQQDTPRDVYLEYLVAVGASEAVSMKQGMALPDVWEADIHHPHQSVNLYDFVELLVRVAHGRYTEMPSIALRMRIMMERDFGPRWPGGLDHTAKQAMENHHQSIYDQFYADAVALGRELKTPKTEADEAKLANEAKEAAAADMVAKAGGTSALARLQPGSKGKKKGRDAGDTSMDVDKMQQLHWRQDIQEWIADRAVRMWKVFHFMAGTAREDLHALLCYNALLKNLIWCELLNPELNVKRTARAIAMTTFDPDVAPQNHPSNDEVLLTYDEFEEALVRFSYIRAKGTVSDDDFIEQALTPFIEELFTQIAYKMPGRF